MKQLQKVIFRSHNEGDSVKLSLPLENVLDVKQTNVFDLAETVKLRVIAGDDTFAIDEYFFTFFSHGKEAMIMLADVVNNKSVRRTIVESEPLALGSTAMRTSSVLLSSLIIQLSRPLSVFRIM